MRLDRNKTKQFVIFLYSMLDMLDRFLHLLRCLQVAVVLEVQKGPYFALNEFGLHLLDHGVDQLVAEDEAVVFADCFLGGVGVIGEEDELFEHLQAVSFSFGLQLAEYLG